MAKGNLGEKREQSEIYPSTNKEEVYYPSAYLCLDFLPAGKTLEIDSEVTLEIKGRVQSLRVDGNSKEMSFEMQDAKLVNGGKDREDKSLLG